MGDWIVFKLAEDATGSGELDGSVVTELDEPFDALEKAAKQALAKAGSKAAVAVTSNGVRLTDAAPAAVAKVAEALEGDLGEVGVAEVKNNEWWDLSTFREKRLPMG